MSTRTTVGIVEWGHRAHGMGVAHRAVADALGGFVGTEPDAVVQRALLERARRHGRCADEWSVVVPVLHDVDFASARSDASLDHVVGDLSTASDGPAALAAEAEVSARVGELLQAWSAEAANVADEPYRAAAERVTRELEVPRAG